MKLSTIHNQLLPPEAKVGISPIAIKRAEDYLTTLGELPKPPTHDMIRLYRGEWIGKIPHEFAFFSDDRGLAGVAIPFARSPGRQLIYVDIPIDVARSCEQSGAVTDGEYQLPEEYRIRVKKFGSK